MNHELIIIAPNVIEGEIVPQGAVLSAQELRSMNFARLEFERLVSTLVPLIDPLLYTEDKTAVNVARHIENIRFYSGNFCWKHRHLGAAHGVVGKRPGDDGFDQ